MGLRLEILNPRTEVLLGQPRVHSQAKNLCAFFWRHLLAFTGKAA